MSKFADFMERVHHLFDSWDKLDPSDAEKTLILTAVQERVGKALQQGLESEHRRALTLQQLEALVDAIGLSGVLDALTEVCNTKAARAALNYTTTSQHIISTSAAWTQEGERIGKLAAQVAL